MSHRQIADIPFLVVEDDAFQRGAIVTILASLGVQNIAEAPDGAAAVELLCQTRTPVEILVCDLNMPRMDGMSFLRQLGALNRNIAVILISAHGQALLESVAGIAEAYKVNVLSVVNKPCGRSQLLEAIRRFLDARQDVQDTSQAKPALRLGKDELEAALRNGEFEPYFQPRVSMVDGKVVGLEALVRWKSRRYGLLLPADFLDAMERQGLSDALTYTTLAKAAALHHDLRAMGLDLRMVVNLAPAALARAEFADRFATLGGQLGFEPADITIEVPATRLESARGISLENYARLHLRGFVLAADGYGGDGSTLRELARLPFGEVTIRANLLGGAGGRESDFALIEGLIQIATKLGLQVDAGGIEQPEQWQAMRRAGCRNGFGNFIAAPMPASEVAVWLAAWRPVTRISPAALHEDMDILLVQSDLAWLKNHYTEIQRECVGKIDTAATVDNALRRMVVTPYRVIVVDAQLGTPGALELIRRIRCRETSLDPAARVVLLLSTENADVLLPAIALDVNGFVDRNLVLQRMRETIRQVLEENFYARTPADYASALGAKESRRHVSASIMWSDAESAGSANADRRQRVHLAKLKEGMRVLYPVEMKDGRMALNAGHVLSTTTIERLREVSTLLKHPFLWVEGSTAGMQ